MPIKHLIRCALAGVLLSPLSSAAAELPNSLQSWANCAGYLSYLSLLQHEEPEHQGHEQTAALLEQYGAASDSFQHQTIYSEQLNREQVFTLARIHTIASLRFHQVDGFGNRVKAPPRFIRDAQNIAGTYCTQWQRSQP
ncbi:hypothetical protein [Aliagarivorans taiwanensis]|uniref:hypothetical protein n=1 Tax=Aliagarivorans taiwanensis TaxID=561966 RepID=UPI000479AD48|nr:hypothetical protein [Aliagarivorans taiwanensis]